MAKPQPKETVRFPNESDEYRAARAELLKAETDLDRRHHLQQRLPWRDGGRQPDPLAQRVRPPRRQDPPLLQFGAPLCSDPGGPGPAPRGSDLAALEPLRLHPGRPRQGLVSEAVVRSGKEPRRVNPL